MVGKIPRKNPKELLKYKNRCRNKKKAFRISQAESLA